MKCSAILSLLTMGSMTLAGEVVRSGHASAQWLAESGTLKPGKTLRTVVRLNVDRDWHVYWANPGDAGMPTSAEFEMPAGWTCSGIQFPVPVRFHTGELHGFGHGGRVDYPVMITVPDDFQGDAELQAHVTWLTCNNEACVPGDAKTGLTVVGGRIAEGNVDIAAVGKAVDALPAAAPKHAKMAVSDTGEHWKVSLTGAKALEFDLSKATLYVETPEVVAASAEVKLQRSGDVWVADFPKSSYAPKVLKSFVLLLVPEGGGRAVRMDWVNADQD